MDPNQDQQSGSSPQVSPADPNAAGQTTNSGMPEGTAAPASPDPGYQQQAAPGSATDTSTGQSSLPGSGTDTMSSSLPGTPTTGTYVPPQPASFLGMPVDSLLVAGPLLIAGFLVFAWLTGRQPHTEQLTRLDKQRKRIEAREAAKPEFVDIFKQDKEDFLGRILAQAGLEAQYEKMKTNWILSAIGTTVAMFALSIMQAPALVPFAFIFGPALGSFGFVQYIKWEAGQRQKRLTAQLPQVLETMVSTLKAGSPVVECFKLLSETAPEPIRSEFKRALVSLQLGKPFRDVLAEMGTRIRTSDFRLLTQAIFISQDVGANLADVVATIAEAIRERFRLRDFLNSLTAQGKMTALFIGSLPYFITGMTYVMAPGYITPFLNHPIARIVFIAMMLWEALGAYILVKMTTFEV
ncbi:MAG: type II secretion system F family protein [Candidatus Obscuribacterales bacterium]|nr:type II secretion system F family protein [Candidatus Obscuribacterales bacterium]